jgi:DNA-binding CsgD family transcriptional regulator
MHGRLAEVVPTLEERARHLALASQGPDAAVAAELDQAAAHAVRRGASVVAARLFELAAQSTPPTASDQRRRRLVDAAEQLRAGGQFAGTRALLEPLAPELARGPEHARALFVLAWTAASWADAVELCRNALEEVEDDELRVRIHHWLGLVWMLQGNVRLSRDHARQAVEIAERAQNPVSLCRAHGLLVLTSMLVGEPVPDSELERARTFEPAARDHPTFYTPSLANAALLVYRDRLDEARAVFEEGLRIVSERGDEEMVVVVMFHLGLLELRAGRWSLAAEHAAYAHEIVSSFESPVRRGTFRYLQGTVAAHQGLAEQARGFLEEAAALTEAFGDRYFAIETSTSLGFLELSLGELEAARERLQPLPDRLVEMGYREPALFESVPTLVEALAGLGRAHEAEPPAELFEGLARAVEAPLALAQAARCRALIAGALGDVAGAHAACAEALAHHERAPWPFERGRTLLVLGAVLRRDGRKAKAREAFTEALALFEQVGARLWADKARTELARISGRRVGGAALTASERELAALIARGLSNREAAAALFVTPKTVETKLSRIYAKVGVHSRTQLVNWLAEEDGQV